MTWEAILLSGMMFTAIPEDDKKQHFAAGAAVSALSEEVLDLSPLQACGMSLLTGVGKEIYDRHSGGISDGKDVLATFAGGCMITINF